jgi:methionyl-tRNA formyltransferase
MKVLNIGYFADGPWSHNALDKIIADNGLKVSFICARHDNPDPILIRYAEINQIPFLTHPNINSDEFFHSVQSFNCDILVSMSFNQIFKERIINCVPEKIINCHAGKLPFYRGRNILNWALINDEKEFGITVHYVDSGIDTGDIIAQKSYKITDEDDYQSLLSRAYIGCADVLYLAIKSVQSGNVKRVPQHTIHPVGFYCTCRKNGDELINWNTASRDLFNFVRAICKPGPQARTTCNGFQVKINKLQIIDHAVSYKGVPGAILFREKCGFFVKTADSFVRIVEWDCDGIIRVGDRLK